MRGECPAPGLDPVEPAAVHAPAVSAIIPTLDEETELGRLLAELRHGGCDEILVVDGGSTDGTLAVALEGADRVLVENGGLAAQLERGARAAGGEVLFFPYADTHLPEGWREHLVRTLAPPDVVAGAFRLAFADPRLRYRCIAGGARLRNALGCGPLGDQALFVQRLAFERAGGYRIGRLLEDLDLVRRLRRFGRVVSAPAPIRSSVRRWERHGLLRTTLRHWMILACDQLGLRGDSLQSRYRVVRQAR